MYVVMVYSMKVWTQILDYHLKPVILALSMAKQLNLVQILAKKHVFSMKIASHDMPVRHENVNHFVVYSHLM